MWLPSPSYTCKTPSSFLGGYPWMQSDTNRCKAFTFSRGFYIFPFCQPQSYLPGTDWTAITKAVGPEWGLSIALRLGWPLRSPQMLVTRVRNFFVGGTAFALSPEHINHKEMSKETPSGYAKLGAPNQQTGQRVFILLFVYPRLLNSTNILCVPICSQVWRRWLRQYLSRPQGKREKPIPTGCCTAGTTGESFILCLVLDMKRIHYFPNARFI